MLNDDIDSEDVADAKLTTPDAVTRRLNRVLHKLTVANTRLAAIKAAYPPGPPCTPDQLTALAAIQTQTTQVTATVSAFAISNPSGGVIGPQ